MHSITVIIPHLNQEAHLRRCLGSLEMQRGQFALDRVIVVDNGSERMPEEVCSAWPVVELTREAEPGPGPARNRGVAMAQSEILAFIDADCVADEGWLAAITRSFAVDAERRILGGDVRILRRDDRHPSVIECYECVYAFRMKEYILKQGFTGTGNLAVRRETMKRVGPFGGLHIAEDRDWGRRATALREIIHYVPDMIVLHPARDSFDELFAKWSRHIAHDYAELPGGIGRIKWIAKAFALALSPMVEFVRILRSDRVSGARERLLAWLGLLRIRFFRSGLMLRAIVLRDAHHISGAWNRK